MCINILNIFGSRKIYTTKEEKCPKPNQPDNPTLILSQLKIVCILTCRKRYIVRHYIN